LIRGFNFRSVSCWQLLPPSIPQNSADLQEVSDQEVWDQGKEADSVVKHSDCLKSLVLPGSNSLAPGSIGLGGVILVDNVAEDVFAATALVTDRSPRNCVSGPAMLESLIEPAELESPTCRGLLRLHSPRKLVLLLEESSACHCPSKRPKRPLHVQDV
jgi:hypothetical protein